MQGNGDHDQPIDHGPRSNAHAVFIWDMTRLLLLALSYALSYCVLITPQLLMSPFIWRHLSYGPCGHVAHVFVSLCNVQLPVCYLRLFYLSSGYPWQRLQPVS